MSPLQNQTTEIPIRKFKHMCMHVQVQEAGRAPNSNQDVEVLQKLSAEEEARSMHVVEVILRTWPWRPWLTYLLPAEDKKKRKKGVSRPRNQTQREEKEWHAHVPTLHCEGITHSQWGP